MNKLGVSVDKSRMRTVETGTPAEKPGALAVEHWPRIVIPRTQSVEPGFRTPDPGGLGLVEPGARAMKPEVRAA